MGGAVSHCDGIRCAVLAAERKHSLPHAQREDASRHVGDALRVVEDSDELTHLLVKECGLRVACRGREQ
jgi:hypothetical protein